MKRKNFLVVLFLLLSMMVIYGCSNNQASTDSTDTNTKVSENKDEEDEENTKNRSEEENKEDSEEDSDDTDEYNQVLSENRANSVKDFLVKNGITADITTKGFGEKKPIATNSTKEGKQLNRRVEIIIPTM